MRRHGSFRGKLITLSVGVLVCYQMLVILFNILFMEPYYLHRVERSLINAYKTLAAMEELDSTVVSQLEEDNLSIVIASREDMTILYNSQTPPDQMHDMVDRVLPQIEETAQDLTDGYFVNTNEIRTKNQSGSSHANTMRRVTLGGITDYYLVDISTTYASIDQAISVSMQFSMLVGIIIILIGTIAYSRLSTLVTRPVAQITDIANKIAHLDFSERCDVNTNDEIGDMAVSINTMSDFMQTHIQQLEQANQLLKEDMHLRHEQNIARNNLLANLSHDLKTPIGLISGYADGLRSGMAKTDTEIREYCDVIVDESDRMMNLIVRMMELFRLESGSVELQPEEFDLADLLNYIVEIFTIEVDRYGLNFTQDYSDCLYIHEDYFSVEQVLTNYMQNAISHMGQEHELKLYVKDTGSSYRVCVFNSAAPLAEDELSHIWDSFYRGDKSRTRSRRESGLGLSIVRGNMELMGGAYGVRNVPGGIEFMAEFAKSPADLSPADASGPDSAEDPSDFAL